MVWVPEAFFAFKALFGLMAYFEPLKAVFPYSSRYELAAGVVSMCHTYLIVLAPLITPDTNAQLIYGRIGFTYFMWDTCAILIFNFSTKHIYLVHHAITLFLCYYASQPETGFYPLDAISNLYYYAECSNVLLHAWTFANKNKRHPYCLQWSHQLTPWFALSYLPFRLFVMPYYALRIVQTISDYTTFSRLQKGGLMIPIGCLIAMSLYYAQIVARVAYKRGFKRMIPKFPNKPMGNQMEHAVRPRIRVEQIYRKY
jgi:hypothetical protein